jgi:hypothetical protein
MTMSDETANQAAEAGALAHLGKQAVAGLSLAHSREDGARLLVAAAEKGSAEADAFISVLIAADARSPADWSLALGYLQRAAERGWSPAREQLCVLSPDRDLAQLAAAHGGEQDVWDRLRNSIDMAALLKPPSVSAVHGEPRIAVAEGFANARECGWMIGRGRTGMQRAQVYDQTKGGGLLDSSRTNSAMLFSFLQMDFVVAILRARIAEAVQFARASLEETNVLHYTAGQEFSRHFDFYDPAQPANADEIKANGQRVGTFLVYLNDDFEGGETDFPAVGWRYRGKPGDALFFMNVDEAGRPDRRTMHAGLPPAAGEKWLLSQWIRGVPGAGL